MVIVRFIMVLAFNNTYIFKYIWTEGDCKDLTLNNLYEHTVITRSLNLHNLAL